MIPVGRTAGSLRSGMELAGRTALLTGATGGLGRAIAEALAARGATLLLSGRKRRGAGGAGRRAARRGPPRRCPPTSPSRARPRSWPPRPARSTSSSPTPACPAPGGCRTSAPSELTRRPARQPRGADAARPGAGAGDARARLRPHGLHLLALRQVGDARSPPSTTRPSSACAASPSACAPTSTRSGVGVSIVSPGIDPRSRHVRRLRRQAADPGPRHRLPAAGRRRGACRAIEQNKVEVAVAPLAAARRSPTSPWPARASRSRSPAATPARRPPQRESPIGPSDATRGDATPTSPRMER